MAQCEYRHKAFKSPNVFSPFNPPTYLHDGSDQCWMQGENVAEIPFQNITGKHYCLFHRHQEPTGGMRGPYKYDGSNVGDSQSRWLENLLREWNAVNETRKGNAPLLSFTFPGIHCGELSLVNFSFSSNIDFTDATFSGDAQFRSAKFSGLARFGSAEFGGNAGFYLTTFGGNTGFDFAIFGGTATFSDSTFNGSATFSDSTFKGNAYFLRTKFNGLAQFLLTRFNKSANFSEGVQFVGAANFDKAVFGEGVEEADNANFDSAVFHNNLSFHGTIFKEKLGFTLTEIKKGGRFTDCEFASLTYSTHIGERLLFNHCSGAVTFKDQDCSRLSFLNMNLDKTDFLGADIKETRFEACRWEKPEDKPRYAVVCGHEEIIKRNQRDELFKLKSLYRQLMKNLEDSRDYKQAGDFHYRDMELREKMIAGGLISKESCVEPWILKRYKCLADYGESYTKLGLWIILSLFITIGVVFVFELIRNCGCSTPSFDSIGKIAKAVLFGIVPSGLSRTVDPILLKLSFVSQLMIYLETFFAIIVGALFVMAVNRRFRR